MYLDIGEKNLWDEFWNGSNFLIVFRLYLMGDIISRAKVEKVKKIA
jgi:hypothetical protein